MRKTNLSFEEVLAIPRGPERRRAMREFGMNFSWLDFSDDELIVRGREPYGPALP